MSSSADTDIFPNPPTLPPRFQIRRLTSAHIPWAAAIVAHSNSFCSPLWPLVYPEDIPSRCCAVATAANYLVTHQISSGLSFGIFDLSYTFKNPSSSSTNGALYWDDENDKHDNMTREKLLEQMDFPLVSVALSYDAINPLDHARLAPLIDQLPLFGTIYAHLNSHDPRDPSLYTPTGPKQILMRNATSTREDYEGRRLMSSLARFLMRHAKGLGFEGIDIETISDAVAHVWLYPPEPFKGELISELDPQTFEMEDETGEVVKPLVASKQVCNKIFVTL